MAYSYKTKENIGNKRTEYSRYYSAFRGVDFSSDHTQVHDSRLAYLVNMYKDYKSGQGDALETIVGFRRKVSLVGKEAPIYGIHSYKHKDKNGKEVTDVFVHKGTGLYKWNYPYTCNITHGKWINPVKIGENKYEWELPKDLRIGYINQPCYSEYGNAVNITTKSEDGQEYFVLTPESGSGYKGEWVKILYVENNPFNMDDTPIAYEGSMNEHKSVSFVFNNKLYICDGKNYLVYDGASIVVKVTDNAYIPTTYTEIIPEGENANTGKEYEQRNILTPYFKHTFIGDGTARTFYMNEDNLDGIKSVLVNGVANNADSSHLLNGSVTLETAPAKGAIVEVTAWKTWTTIEGLTEEVDDIAEVITGCTIFTTFGERVFCSGNPKCPNQVFYCGRNNNTGYIDPSYFGVLNRIPVGVGNAPVTGLMGVANTLMILKADTQQDASIYYCTETITESNVMPVVYTKQAGLSGLGCLGACCNFLDDPVFVSRLGLEGISTLQISSERTIEHRSSLVDAKLINCDLSNAFLEEYGGYLWLLVDGQVFLADSRQRYTDALGVAQYEWYYFDGIGVWDNQYEEYKYSKQIADDIKGVLKVEIDGVEVPVEIVAKELQETTANPNKETIEFKNEVVTMGGVDVHIPFNYIVKDGHAYLCESKGNYIGGTFRKATVLKVIDDNLYFGCENGVVCSFNFDERLKDGTFPSASYHFDNRIIVSGCATVMDNCKIPHLTKSTIKRSTVIKTKSFANSTAKIKVRTNKKPYEQIARINSGLFSFDSVDFGDLSFATGDESLFAVKEQEKQWVEKQYYVYTDEYMKPFSLHYISYRYKVAGRVKN